jgi:hypothetical protein
MAQYSLSALGAVKKLCFCRKSIPVRIFLPLWAAVGVNTVTVVP